MKGKFEVEMEKMSRMQIITRPIKAFLKFFQFPNLLIFRSCIATRIVIFMVKLYSNMIFIINHFNDKFMNNY